MTVHTNRMMAHAVLDFQSFQAETLSDSKLHALVCVCVSVCFVVVVVLY